MKKTCILSIDGGGIRGIIPAYILSQIEKHLPPKSGNNEGHLADYFDLVAGTSTGGILTCALLLPDQNGRPALKASQILDLYLQRGTKIFSRTLKQLITSAGGLTDEKYSSRELRAALTHKFGNTKLSELLRPCIVTSYDIERRKTHFFKQHLALEDKEKQFYLTDVALSTASAPTYFETCLVKNEKKNTFSLIDGGIFANNPALCAYAEARSIDFSTLTPGKPKRPRANQMFILSLDTALIKRSYSFEKARNWGKPAWIQPAIDMMMTGNSETVDYQLRQIFNTLHSKDKFDYMRTNVYLGNADPAMDCASPENMGKLVQTAKNYLEMNPDFIERVVGRLLEYN